MRDHALRRPLRGAVGGLRVAAGGWFRGYKQMRSRLAGVLGADTFARGLKALSGLVPYEHTCKIRYSEPDRFILRGGG